MTTSRGRFATVRSSLDRATVSPPLVSAIRIHPWFFCGSSDHLARLLVTSSAIAPDAIGTGLTVIPRSAASTPGVTPKVASMTVSPHEIAQRFGLPNHRIVLEWRFRRADFPAPATRRRTYLWRWAEIEAWRKANEAEVTALIRSDQQ